MILSSFLNSLIKIYRFLNIIFRISTGIVQLSGLGFGSRPSWPTLVGVVQLGGPLVCRDLLLFATAARQRFGAGVASTPTATTPTSSPSSSTTATPSSSTVHAVGGQVGWKGNECLTVGTFAIKEPSLLKSSNICIRWGIWCFNFYLYLLQYPAKMSVQCEL